MADTGVKIGDSVTRLEDEAFITGQGRYTADLQTDGMKHAVFVRASVAHGRILDIETDDAVAMPGVVAILTGRDAAEDGLGTIPTIIPMKNRDGSDMFHAPRPVLPTDKVRYVGEPLALVIAETMAAARDAAEAVYIDVEELPPVMGASRSFADAESVVHDGGPGNQAFDWAIGEEAATVDALDAAPHVVEFSFHQNRMAGVALEGRAVLAEYDQAADQVTLTSASQGVHMIHQILTGPALNWPRDRLRVISPDVGGGFGPKFFIYAEQAMLAWAARRLNCAMRWVSDRAESFSSETHARDQDTTARLGFDNDGRFLAIWTEATCDMGAYLSTFAPGIPTDGMAKVMASIYHIPAAWLNVRGAYTNTVPVDAYRGAGKPPMLFALERLIDLAARKLDMDAAEIRRRNLIPAEAMPYTTALGKTYDGGNYPKAFDQAIGASGWMSYADRHAASRAKGLARGRSVIASMHGVGGLTTETSRVTIDGNAGGVTAWTGTQSTGQGHKTVYAQILSDRLGLPINDIAIKQGDTAMLARGGGTGGSSSMIISGSTLNRTAATIIEKGRARAADRLEAAESDIQFEDGTYTVTGTDLKVTLYDLSRDEPLQAEEDFQDSVAAFPYGVMVAEVELDPETGQVTLDRVLSVDDAGKVINPLLLAGQVHGGLAQGIGQALLEEVVYDEDGQILTGSFMDYGMPRADDLPSFDVGQIETLSSTSPIGMRGIGELPANGAPAAIANAIADALTEYGVAEVPQPARPDRIWRLIKEAKSK